MNSSTPVCRGGPTPAISLRLDQRESCFTSTFRNSSFRAGRRAAGRARLPRGYVLFRSTKLTVVFPFTLMMMRHPTAMHFESEPFVRLDLRFLDLCPMPRSASSFPSAQPGFVPSIDAS